MSHVPAAIANRMKGINCVHCGAPGCPNEQMLISRHGNPLAPEHKYQLAFDLGWRVGKDARLDRCADCVARESAGPSPVNYNRADDTRIYDLFNLIAELPDVDWRGNENMFASMLMAMVSYLDRFVSERWHEVQPNHQSLIAAQFKELLNTLGSELGDGIGLRKGAPERRLLEIEDVKRQAVESVCQGIQSAEQEVRTLQAELARARAQARPITTWLQSLGRTS